MVVPTARAAAAQVITMIFAVLGFLSPANRGGLMTAMLLLFVFMGVPAGFSSAFLHKTLKGVEWKKNILLTSCLFTGRAAGSNTAAARSRRRTANVGPAHR